MIYGKIWLYVKPSTGIPVYLGAVAIGAIAVHLALFLNVPWLKAYYSGSAGKAAVTAAADAVAALPGAVTAKK
jgi:light-harvesting protein B-800-850 alpha chain